MPVGSAADALAAAVAAAGAAHDTGGAAPP